MQNIHLDAMRREYVHSKKTLLVSVAYYRMFLDRPQCLGCRRFCYSWGCPNGGIQGLEDNFFMRYNSKRFGREIEHFDLLMGQTYVREAILAGKSAQEISAMWQEDVRRFQKQRRPYLLYDEVF